MVGWAGVVIFLNLLGFNIINYLQYKLLEPLLSQNIIERQIFETSLIAESLRPTRIRLFAEDSTIESSRELQRRLVDFLKSSNFNSISILDRRGDVVLSTLSEYEAGEFYPYLENDAEAFDSALTGTARATELYQIGGRTFMGSYAPIRGELSQVEYVVAVEAGAMFFQLLASQRRNLLVFGILSIFVAIGGAILLFSASVFMRKLEHRLATVSTMAALGQMAAGLAHDIRNPLAIIRGSAERLPNSTAEKQVELLRYISEEAERIDSTIEDYLSLTKMSEIETIKLDELVGKIIARFSNSTSKIEFETKFTGSTELLAPKILLERAIFNLIQNAIEALPEGGRIEIFTLADSAGTKILISDNGKGMSKKTASHIFEPFFTTKMTGSGIGLSIAKKLIEDAGGTLKLIQFGSSGCSFEIRLQTKNKT